MTKLGIMSFAHMHAYSYAASIKQLDGVELATIWDDDAARGKTVAAQYGVPFHADLNAFLKSDVEGVIICSENIKHRAMTEAAANAGKWILCEKPLATTIGDAQAMVDLCKSKGVGLGTAFPCRHVPTLMAVKVEIADGKYGQIYAATCTNNGSFPGGWFADEAQSGGGATMDHTVHVADALRWMLGREFTQVYCECDNLIRHGIGTDDVGSLHLEMEGGIKITHVASWNRAKSFPTWGDVTMEIIGEKGVVTVDAFNQKINLYNDEAMKTQWVGFGDNSDFGLVRDFANSIRERRDPAASGVDGLRAVEVTVAAYKSAKRKARVTV
ncbi:MAG: Gfo/Idh/MocA family oxidoreductase [Candidatus Hydrogenedentes bacterium]|nr:Gfo/Idh/MocA family oxidoreductase [Candidatus Hydrogenedentota bacterium]